MLSRTIKMPGTPDYRERVDFGEFIGYYVNDKNPDIKLPTPKGTIRYSKKGRILSRYMLMGNKLRKSIVWM